MGSTCTTCLKEETTTKKRKPVGDKAPGVGKKGKKYKVNEAEKLRADAVATIIEDIEYSQHAGEVPTHTWRFKKGFGSPTVTMGSVPMAAQRIAGSLSHPPVDPKLKAMSPTTDDEKNHKGKNGRAAGSNGMIAATPLELDGEEMSLVRKGPKRELTTLNLANQKFGNAGCQAITAALANCGPKSVGASITTLNLRKNDLTDEGAQLICDALKKKGASNANAPIKVLNLEENSLTSQGLVQVGTLICSCPDLESLSFSIAAGSEVDEAALAILHESLSHTDKLKTWKFSRVGSGGSSAASAHSTPPVGGRTPPPAGAKKNKRESVAGQGEADGTDADGNSGPITTGGFTPSTLQNFFEKMVHYRDRVQQLEMMGLYDCLTLSASGETIAMVAPMRSLGRWLKSMYCKLTTLELKLPLGDKGTEVLANSLGNITTLQSLTISRCSIGHAGCTAIAEGLAKNTSLKRLDISHQPGLLEDKRINEESLVSMAQALAENCTLSELNILELGMPKLATEAFIAALESNKKGTQLIVFSHSLIADDVLGVQLAQNLRSTKQRLGLAVGNSAVQSQASSTSFGAVGIDFDDAGSDFSVEDDVGPNPVGNGGRNEKPGGGGGVKIAKPSKSGESSAAERRANRGPQVTTVQGSKDVYSPTGASPPRSNLASNSNDSNGAAEKKKKKLIIDSSGGQPVPRGAELDDTEINLEI